MANTKPPEYDGVSTIEMAQVEVTECGFNRVKLVRSTSIPLHLPQFLTMICQILVQVSGNQSSKVIDVVLCYAQRLTACVNYRKYMATRSHSYEPHRDEGSLQSVRQQDQDSCGPFVLLVCRIAADADATFTRENADGSTSRVTAYLVCRIAARQRFWGMAKGRYINFFNNNNKK